MPLLSVTQVKQALSESGVKDQKDIKKLLEAEGLAPNDLIAELGTAIRGADSSAMRLRGIEMGMKLNGLLKNNDDGVVAPVVNIIINDSEFSNRPNPILIPREKI